MDNKLSYKRFAGGIADSLKEGAAGQIPDQYYFGQSVDYRTDPQSLTLLPGAVKESGNVVIDLLKCADITPNDLSVYSYGSNGNFYKRTSAGSWSALRTVANSHGNGLAYFSGDDYIYYTLDKVIGRYGPVSGTPQFSDNFLGAQGGVRLNTYSATMVAASSQYASVADSVSLSITGNLTLECYINPTSLPAAGSSQTLVSKWDESGALRSYRFDIAGISAQFGDGSDGVLTISANTTESPIDSACTGTVGTYTLSATNASFVAGQQILIHQTQGTSAGTWMRTSIVSYTAGTITTNDALNITYSTGAQVRVLKQYSSVTVNSGITWTAKAWNGTVGGLLAFLCSGTTTINGTISANGGNGSSGTPGVGGTGGGFRGGNANQNAYPLTAYTGEGFNGVSVQSTSANGNGGGAGAVSGDNSWASGGGGGNGGVGQNGQLYSNLATVGAGGGTSGTADLTNLTYGGGGGGACTNNQGAEGAGGAGGGGIFITATTLTITGAITSNGGAGAGYSGGVSGYGGGGGGAGGSVLLKVQTATLGSSLITANGGLGGVDQSGNQQGGKGGPGRIHIDYYTSYTGTTTPTLNATQDNTLVTNTTYQLRLSISSTGSNSEIMTRQCSLTTGVWKHVACVWTAASHITEFFLNGNSLGTSTGALTAIHDNTSTFQLGMYKNATVPTAFFNGEMDEVRVWATTRTASQLYAYKDTQISTSSLSLNAYYQLNNNWNDSTANANNLTASGSPTFTVDVPFLSPTTRLDIDTQSTTTGQIYTLLTSISESAVDKLSFTPVNDPQSSVGFYVNAAGTGNWTVTVHDSTNTVVATQTILAANVPTSGLIEFVFTTAWRIVYKQSYHMHLTVSTGTSSVVTSVASDFSTAEYATYFGFLVNDSNFHPAVQFQYQPLGGTLTGAVIIGNERYLAVWDGTTYIPNFLTLMTGWHVRCFAQWRQYLAIGVWKGSNIYDFQPGRIYFWSGYQPAYDFFIDVPEGQINALFGVNSDLYLFAGYQGQLIDYKGGFFTTTGNSSSSKLKKMPLLETSAYTEVYPYALNMYRGLLHFGLYANSTSITSQRGVYSYGTLNQFYPESLSYDYPISTGNRGSTVSIGLVYPVGQNLLIGWQDGSAYGCDVVNFSNAPASSGEIQLLLNDGGTVWKNENNLAFRIDHNALKTGESITPEINFDRKGFTSLTTSSVVGDTFLSQPISQGRASEVQIGAILSQTNGTSPRLTALTIAQDPLSSETQL